MKSTSENILVSNIKDETKDTIIGRVKDEILEEVTKIIDKVRDEVKRAMETYYGCLVFL